MMTLLAETLGYVLKMVVFVAVAAAGIALGIKLRKNKDQKQTDAQ